MTTETPLIERLLKVKSPRDCLDWKDGYYVASCQVSHDDVPALLEIAAKWSESEWMPETNDDTVSQEVCELLPVTAWRALGDLQATDTVQPLLEMLEKIDGFDDWSHDELPELFGKFGEPAIEPLRTAAQNADKPPHVRTLAVTGLRYVAELHPSLRGRIVGLLTELMSNARDGQLSFNTALMAELLDLKAVEAAEAIERAFARNLVDVCWAGPWETVREELGVPGLGLPMPEDPCNSLTEWRASLASGELGKRLGLSSDDLDDDSGAAYRDHILATFEESSEAREFADRHGQLQWAASLLYFGEFQHGINPQELTLEDVREYILDYMPRKVTTEPKNAAKIINELLLFWQFMARSEQHPAANGIVAWLQEPGMVKRLQKDLADTSKFGMAKSFFHQGLQAGYDMATPEGINAFREEFNNQLELNRQLALPVLPELLEPEFSQLQLKPFTSSKRIGRNDPCTCGSGKKYKKCCGRMV